VPIKPIARAEPASVQRICVHIQRDRRNDKKALGTAKIARNRRSVPMQHGIQHGYADLGDVRLHYVTAGQGPAVVLLHGWPQTWFMWRDILPGLAARYRVIAPDLRGLGDSSRPVGGYDNKTLADDVWRLAHGVLGERRVFSWPATIGAGRRPSPWPRSTATPSAGSRCSTRRFPATARR
jgi:hypothetical protein